MAPAAQNSVPRHFPAGTTVKYVRSFDEYLPSDGWTYTIYLNGATQKFNKAATTDADSNQFAIEFIPSDTASLPPGAYRYAERLSNTDTGEIYDLRGDDLVINIEANVATASAGAFNTWEENQLSMIESVLAGRITSDVAAYQIAGRSVTKIPIQELRQIRGELKAAIWRQENPGRLGVPYKVEFPTETDGAEFPPTWVDVTGFER